MTQSKKAGVPMLEIEMSGGPNVKFHEYASMVKSIQKTLLEHFTRIGYNDKIVCHAIKPLPGSSAKQGLKFLRSFPFHGVPSIFISAQPFGNDTCWEYRLQFPKHVDTEHILKQLLSQPHKESDEKDLKKESSFDPASFFADGIEMYRTVLADLCTPSVVQNGYVLQRPDALRTVQNVFGGGITSEDALAVLQHLAVQNYISMQSGSVAFKRATIALLETVENVLQTADVIQLHAQQKPQPTLATPLKKEEPKKQEKIDRPEVHARAPDSSVYTDVEEMARFASVYNAAQEKIAAAQKKTNELESTRECLENTLKNLLKEIATHNEELRQARNILANVRYKVAADEIARIRSLLK